MPAKHENRAKESNLEKEGRLTPLHGIWAAFSSGFAKVRLGMRARRKAMNRLVKVMGCMLDDIDCGEIDRD